MELVDRFKKIGNFISMGLFLLFMAIGRTDNFPIILYCGVPVAFSLGVIHFFVGLYKIMYGTKSGHWAYRVEPYVQFVMGLALFLVSFSLVYFAAFMKPQ